MVIRVILRKVAKSGGDNKPDVVLWIKQVLLFSDTAQDDLVALPPKSSAPLLPHQLRSARWYDIRPNPTINNKDGVAFENDTTDTTVNQTVTFHDDGPVVVKEFPRYVSIGEQFRDASIDSRTHDIQQILGRPILCASGNWATTNLAGTQLQSIALPSACLSNAAYADKLRGFMGFRAKMVCRVQVNSQRFQQGRLLLHYLPQTATMPLARKECALSSLILISQQPRVDFNLNEDTEVRLEIPYVSNSLYYDMQNGAFDFGTFYLTVYSPLRTGAGTANCSYSVWCHFEDVEIAYPAVSQGGVKIGRGRGGASTGSVDVSDVELRNEGLGPISGMMSKASRSASILSEIPLISAFTAPTSWALGVLGRAADALGYSKPTNAGPTERRTLTTFAYMNNVNAVDNSTKMALRSDNQVAQLPGFAGTDIDEMSLNHILSIPSYWVTSPWTTAMGVGTRVIYHPLGPATFNVDATVNSGGAYTVTTHTPVSYFNNIFQYWRGSITITYKVVKTEFHSGRLQVSFFPGRNFGQAGATLANSQYVFREILDLRTASEFSITFPYTSLTPYLSAAESFGSVDVRVINPLVAPENLATSVDIIQEISVGPDFEFAVPIPARAAPIVFSPQGGRIFHSQAGGSATSDQTVHAISEQAVNPQLEPALYCVGERVQSIRQLIKRFTTFWVPAAVINGPIAIDPQLHYVQTLRVTGGAVTVPELRTDMVSYFSQLFRFARGGMKFKIIDSSNLTGVLTAQIRVATSTAGAPVAFGYVAPGATCDQPAIFLPSLQGGAEIEMPYYNSTHASHVRYYSGPTQNPAREAYDSPLLLQVAPSTAFSLTSRVYRAAADDYSLGFFIGTVPTCASAVFNPTGY